MPDQRIISDTAVPQPTPADGSAATLNPARDLKAEREAEQARDKQEAAKKQSRFMSRRITVPERPVPSAPEYETYMFEAAANNPFASLRSPAPSTFVPNASVLFFHLMYMDHLMANTKRWVDNCLGWAPPISQMYIGVLFYIQTLRAMDSASLLTPSYEFSTLLMTFINVFPLTDLWIPGPLVAYFRHISSFWPSASDQFGNVSPEIPPTPEWSRNDFYVIDNATYAPNAPNALNLHLPNIAAFVSRLRTICATATTANMTQSTFVASVDGPIRAANMFQIALNNGANEQLLLRGPGLNLAYPENLQMWINASYRLASNSIPFDLNAGAAAGDVENDWSTFIRFDNNQHHWFGSTAAIMAKYCQFFHGSAPLSEIVPNSSAAGAVKLRFSGATDINTAPTWHAAVPGPPAVAAHYTLRTNARVVLNGRCAVEDIPTAHLYAGMTFAINAYHNQNAQNDLRKGRFWTLGPDTSGRDNIEVLPGTLTTIVRRYHSDTRIAAEKQ